MQGQGAPPDIQGQGGTQNSKAKEASQKSKAKEEPQKSLDMEEPQKSLYKEEPQKFLYKEAPQKSLDKEEPQKSLDKEALQKSLELEAHNKVAMEEHLKPEAKKQHPLFIQQYVYTKNIRDNRSTAEVHNPNRWIEICLEQEQGSKINQKANARQKATECYCEEKTNKQADWMTLQSKLAFLCFNAV
ncbi:hypothetical protein NDU88_003747 [Pleurodeles waltl]|uniref:Uncharacterized protein n=1 Tax=Pleurodeles waltl TaxID=8319 RepID=A0AAV7W6H4_PLEWA|nr:hypothetical protein NDU88_003747 [Pleurodeles waltl]